MFGGSFLGSLFLLWLLRFREAFDEGLHGRSTVHAAPAVRPGVIVAVHVGVENGVHFVDQGASLVSSQLVPGLEFVKGAETIR